MTFAKDLRATTKQYLDKIGVKETQKLKNSTQTRKNTLMII